MKRNRRLNVEGDLDDGEKSTQCGAPRTLHLAKLRKQRGVDANRERYQIRLLPQEGEYSPNDVILMLMIGRLGVEK